MSSDKESQIASCLAYEVLRNPDAWIGYPSPSLLYNFLFGADLRARFGHPSFPDWRIYGVLNDRAFYHPFVKATGHPTLTFNYTALEMTHFSLVEGFAKLRDEALAWHRAKGIYLQETDNSGSFSALDVERFWPAFFDKPAMYTGSRSGWPLYCCLSGMERGGDWLQLPEMPRLREIFGAIKTFSENHYGSPFAAFRFHDAQELFKRAGLLPKGNGQTI